MNQQQNNPANKPSISNKEFTNASYSVTANTEQTPSVVTSFLHTEVSSGPLPRPELLKEYDNIIPNGAERIMRMSEKEQDSIISERKETRIDKKELAMAQINLIKRGQNMGFILALILFGLATLFVLTGHERFAYVLFSFGAISLIGLFVNNKKETKKKEEL